MPKTKKEKKKWRKKKTALPAYLLSYESRKSAADF
jgi:hypothetical protein